VIAGTVRFASDCFVNLSAFVLTGSHLILFNTKAESIVGTLILLLCRVAAQLRLATDCTDLHGFFLLRRKILPQRHEGTKGKLLRNLGFATTCPDFSGEALKHRKENAIVSIRANLCNPWLTKKSRRELIF
jgi:hypothetical protein